MDINKFKYDCLREEHDVIVQRYLLDGSSYFFDNNEKTDEFQFKKDIAKSLNVHIRDIVIVGSGKLGFSIKPDKDEPAFYPFRSFDDNKKSDIDIAIVSEQFFNNQLIRLYNYTSGYSNQDVWNKASDRNSLAKYILKGWLKPEFIPKGYKISDQIQKVQSKYKMKFGRDINIGIYKSWFFFENYHKNNIKNIYLNLIANE